MALTEERRRKALEIINANSVPLVAPIKMTPERRNQALEIINGSINNSPDALPSPDEYTYGERALQLGRGLTATGPGGVAELIAEGSIPYTGRAPGETLGLMMLGKAPEEIQALKAEHPSGSIQQRLTEAYDKLAGRDLTPKDLTGEILQTTGELLTPVPGSGYKTAGSLGKTAASIGSHLLKKELPTAVGAATAVHATPSFTDEGSKARIAEDLAKMIAGGKAGKMAASGTGSLLKGKIPGKETLEKGAAKLMSYGTNPEKEVLELAKKYGVELPHNIGTGKGAGSSVQNFLANNYLSKSIFSSGKYKKVYQDADEALVQKIRESIGSLGESKMKPSEASAHFKEYVKGEEPKIKKIVDKLYDESESLLTKKDKVSPDHTGKAIIEMQKKLKSDLKGSDNILVSKHLSRLKKKWGISNPSKKTEGKIVSKDIHLSRLVGVDREINAILGSQEPVGVKKFLRGLQNAVQRDIESSSNKDFVNSYNSAKDYFKENIGERFRGKESRSILKNKGAIDAYNYLNSVNGIKNLERMAGRTQEGMQNLNALKKIKAEEILGKSIEGAIEDGKLKKDAFAKIFEKGQKGQEVLENIIGRDQYNKLSEVSKIARSFSEHGKDLLNTSHTGITLHNITEANALLLNTLGALFGYVPPSAALGSALVVAVPQVLSRVASNKNIVNQARMYALARQAGNEKYAATIMKRLVKMVEKESRPILSTITKKSKEGKENE